MKGVPDRVARIFALAAASVLPSFPLPAQTNAPLRTHQDAMGDWTTDAPGVRHIINLDDLPPPHDTPSVDNGPHIVPRPADAWPKAPPARRVITSMPVVPAWREAAE